MERSQLKKDNQNVKKKKMQFNHTIKDDKKKEKLKFWTFIHLNYALREKINIILK